MNTKLKSLTKEDEEEERKRRSRDCIVLCMNHMINNGFVDSTERLAQESGIPSDKFELCDNISLMQTLIDFEAFQELKYGQKAKICKLSKKGDVPKKAQNLPPLSSGSEQKSSRVVKKLNPTKPQITTPQTSKRTDPLDNESGLAPRPPPNPPKRKEEEERLPADVRLMKPIPPQLRADFGDLTSVIARDIFIDNPGVKWSDIVGLSGAKRVLREAVVMPLRYPQLFAGKKLLTPWKGVLLHGPPGTGKTLLAKAVAGEGTTFFNVSASTLVSKWRGDSEKLIRVLFELARYHAPSTIFIDELDSIMSKRSSEDEHEASRRMKTEMLTQMDGLVQSDALVFVLAASNFPFDLDPALLRRLEKRILVPLPDVDAREDMFRKFLTPDIASPSINFRAFAEKTEKYSGSDIHLLCKEAAMEPLRRLMAELQEKYGESYLDEQLQEDLKLDPIEEADVEAALKRTSASATYDLDMYEKWQNKFGVV